MSEWAGCQPGSVIGLWRAACQKSRRIGVDQAAQQDVGLFAVRHLIGIAQRDVHDRGAADPAGEVAVGMAEEPEIGFVPQDPVVQVRG